MFFQARLHGFNITLKDDEEAPLFSGTPEDVKAPQDFVFGDPKDYKNLSNKAKEELTQKMMGMHKKWVQHTPL